MKISNKNKFIILLLLFSFSTSFVPTRAADEATTPEVQQSHELPSLDQLDPELLELLKKEQADLLEPMLGRILDQIKKIDSIFELWAQIVNNNQLRNGNKKEIIEQITFWRKNIIGQLMKSSHVVVDPVSIKILGDITKALIAHLDLIAQNGLKDFPELPFEDIITRSANEEIDFEAIAKTIEQNEIRLAKLDRESKYIGLTFFNRLYRKSEQFASDYGVLNKLFIGCGVTLAGYILIGKLDSRIADNIYGVHWLKEKFFKDAPKYGLTANPNGEGNILTVSNWERLSIFGKLQHYLSKEEGLGILNLTIPELLTIPVIASFYRSDYQGFVTWFKKNLETVRGKLRGGPIEHKVESWDKEPQFRFKDIIGKEHIKNELMRIVHFIRDQDRYIRAGNRPETGYLLLGGTGTGKSAMAEALAGEMKDALAELGLADKFHFYSYSAADIKFWGGIDVVVWKAKQNAPCVIFIDEMDMTMWQRDRDADNTSLALTTLSGVMTKDIEHTVIIIGATNRAKNLDSALLRKGRFGKLLFFDNPTYQDRLAFLKQELENRSIITIADEYLARLAAESDKCILPQLSAVIEKALYYAKVNNETLTEEHLERAFDEEIRQIIFDNITIPDNELQLIAVHEAGHTLATLLLNTEQQLVKTTLLPVMAHIQEEAVWMKYWENKNRQKPVEHGKTFVAQSIQNSLNIESYDELIKQLKLELAGHAAEMVVYGNSSFRHHISDRERALAIAKQLAAKGLQLDMLDERQREKINQQAMEILERCEQEIMQLLNAHKEKLMKLADALKEKVTMTASDVSALLA